MTVTKDENIVLKGTRDLTTGLWRVSLQIIDRPTHQRNIIHPINDKENDIKYLHAVVFIPVQDTWEYHLTGANSIHLMESWKKTSKICLRLMTQPRATSQRSGRTHNQQQPKRVLETSIRARIQANNKITSKHISLWLQ